MAKIINRKSLIILFSLFILILIIDRYYWAQVSQWREDQATNIWLGYTHNLNNIPIGLMSQENIPNPNGMVILGRIFSFLPNLVMVSLFLGLLQIILLILISWVSFQQNHEHLLLILIPTATSIILRSTSIEFWNQYMLGLINLLFLLFSLSYLKKPSLWFIPLFTALTCIAPSLYLAGIVNAMTITIMATALIFIKRPPKNNITQILLVTLLIILSSLVLTWLPYFTNIDIQKLSAISHKQPGLNTALSMVKTAWKSFFEFPVYTTFQWADRVNFNEAFKHADGRILSLPTNRMLKLVAHLYLFQATFAFSTSAYGFFRSKSTNHEFKINYDPSVMPPIAFSTLFIIISFTFSVWLGGPDWMIISRPDQIVQFLPLSLFVIFLLPFLFVMKQKEIKIIEEISRLSLVLFGLVNLIGGFMVLHDQLTYRGSELTEADVPLIDKMVAIRFIANDWDNYSDSMIIPVDYYLEGNKWGWVPEFGLSLTPWYPEAVFTEGRGFDYAFKRQYGLTNQQEGVQLRTFGTGRYLVTYAFEDEPVITTGSITHYIFGRLRVSIVER